MYPNPFWMFSRVDFEFKMFVFSPISLISVSNTAFWCASTWSVSISEFINSKVQKPISFHYQAYLYERKKIGLIHIPQQERPFFLKEDFANLKKYVVYVRRGESILEADTGEVAKIKEFASPEKEAEPLLKVEFSNSKKKIPLGKHLTMTTFLI